jgi:hypothetical protein
MQQAEGDETGQQVAEVGCEKGDTMHEEGQCMGQCNKAYQDLGCQGEQASRMGTQEIDNYFSLYVTAAPGRSGTWVLEPRSGIGGLGVWGLSQ